MTAQTILILVDRRVEKRNPVGRADAHNPALRTAHIRRFGEIRDAAGGMRVMAVYTGGVAILVQQRAFTGLMRVGRLRERMSDLR
jgi:hypothetical protein